MAHVTQSEFARAVRGGAVTVGVPPPVEPLVLGLSSIARAAVRRVHKQSAAAATQYFDQKASGYLNSPGPVGATAQRFRDSLDRYIQWDATAPAAHLDISNVITFGSGNSVRALAHVTVDDGNGAFESRVLFWDDLALATADAEVIALPVLESAETRLGLGTVSRIQVWQLGTNTAETVLPAAARARQGDVQHLLAQM